MMNKLVILVASLLTAGVRKLWEKQKKVAVKGFMHAKTPLPLPITETCVHILGPCLLCPIG